MRDHGGSLVSDGAVVEDVSRHARVGGDERGRTRGGDPERVVRLRRQVLAQARAEHLAPVGSARVRRAWWAKGGRRKPRAAGEGRGGRALRPPQATDCCGCAPGCREAFTAHAAFRRAAGAWSLGRRGGARFPPGWRAASALELHLPPLASRREQLAQVHGRAVAQLARKVAELVAAVAVRRRLRSGQQLVATEEGRKVRPLHLVSADAEQREHVRRGRYQPRPLERRRSCQAEARARHPAWCRSVLRVGIHWQRTQLQVVKGELLQRACRTAVDVHRVCVGLHRGGCPARSDRPAGYLLNAGSARVNRWNRAQEREDMNLYVSCTVRGSSCNRY